MAKREIKKKFKGIANVPFRIRDKSYAIGDVFVTLSEDTFKILINSKKIK